MALISSGDISWTTLISNTKGDNEDVRVAHTSCPVSRKNGINGLADWIVVEPHLAKIRGHRMRLTLACPQRRAFDLSVVELKVAISS